MRAVTHWPVCLLMHTYGAVLLVGGYSKIPGKYVTTLAPGIHWFYTFSLKAHRKMQTMRRGQRILGFYDFTAHSNTKIRVWSCQKTTRKLCFCQKEGMLESSALMSHYFPCFLFVKGCSPKSPCLCPQTWSKLQQPLIIWVASLTWHLFSLLLSCSPAQ